MLAACVVCSALLAPSSRQLTHPPTHPSAHRYQKTPLSEARVVFYGAGSSSVGVATMIATYMQQRAGITWEEAQHRIFMVDSKGGWGGVGACFVGADVRGGCSCVVAGAVDSKAEQPCHHFLTPTLALCRAHHHHPWRQAARAQEGVCTHRRHSRHEGGWVGASFPCWVESGGWLAVKVGASCSFWCGQIRWLAGWLWG